MVQLKNSSFMKLFFLLDSLRDSNSGGTQVFMYKQEEKVQGKGQSNSKAATLFDCALGWKLYSITVWVERSHWKPSPHQYQKGDGLSGSSYMPNIWSLNGFLSYIVEEGEILDMLYCTGIDTFCLTLFRGFQAVQDDTGGVDTGILNSQETTGFLLFWCGMIFCPH